MPRKLWLVLTLTAVTACGGSGPRPVKDQPQEMLGKPPTPEDDPYFYAVRPPESARAETTGTIGDSEEEEAEGEDQADDEQAEVNSETAQPEEGVESPADEVSDESAASAPAVEKLRREVVSLEQELADEKSRAVRLKASNLELQSRLEELQSENARIEKEAARAETSKPSAESTGAQCYSCVRICPLKGSCSEDAELICGWGTGEDRSKAKRRAKAECDGTLDRLRRREFSRIEGDCPAATCR